MEREASEEGAPSASPRPSSTKLFLGGLSWETDEDKLKKEFEGYGEITEVVVMRDRVTNKPRGFGFITFTTEEACQSACADPHLLDGRQIDVKPSVPQGESQRPRSKKIFVGGLAPETTEDLFKVHFEQYGKIVEAQIMVDHNTGRSRGFGFITFEDESSVEKVFSAGSMHELAGKKVEVKNATPKGSGPQGRSLGAYPDSVSSGGRGVGGGMGGGAGGRGAGYPGGRMYGGEMQGAYGMPGGYMPGGYGMMGYGYGVSPYGAYPPPGMVVGYPGFAYPAGYGYGSPMGYGYQQGAGQPGQQQGGASAAGQQAAQQQPGGGPAGSSAALGRGRGMRGGGNGGHQQLRGAQAPAGQQQG